MQDDNEEIGYAFPFVDGMVQGRFTKLLNGFLGQATNGGAFIIPDEDALIAICEQGARELALDLIKKLKDVDNAQAGVSFTFMSNDPISDLVPSGLDSQSKRTFMGLLSQMNVGIPPQPANISAPQQFTRTNPMHEVNEEPGSGVKGEDMDRIHQNLEKGNDVVIQTTHKKKNKHY